MTDKMDCIWSGSVKKLSKSKRKKAQEKQIRRDIAMKKAGKPFSKNCHHYSYKFSVASSINSQMLGMSVEREPELIGAIKVNSLLRTLEDGSYECSQCRRIFSTSQEQRLEQLYQYLEEPIKNEDFKRELLEEIILYPPIYSSYESAIEQIYRLMFAPRLEKVNRIIDNEINKIL